MHPTRLITVLLTALVVGPGSDTLLLAQYAQSGTATVQLQAEVKLAGPQVKLGDVAKITDRDRDRQLTLLALDLATLVPDQELTLERSFIEIRILLAGYDPASVTVKGPDRITISPPPEVLLTDLGVEQAVFESLCQQFSISAEDLRVKLVSPFISSFQQGLESLQHPRLELMPTPQLPLGRVQLTVRILDGSRVVAAKPVAFEIARRQQVVVAMSSLDRTHTITADHIREETRFVDAPIDRLTSSQVIGRTVALPFRPDEVITLRHLGQQAVEESPILVQPRDAVRLVAKKRGLTVTIPVAEALQAGREGQLIRVRNVQSQQIVTGTVVGRGEVHVTLP